MTAHTRALIGQTCGMCACMLASLGQPSGGQACLEGAQRAFIETAVHDSLEIRNPSIVRAGRELFVVGGGPLVWRSGRGLVLDEPFRAVRFTTGAFVDIGKPAISGRYLYARAWSGVHGGVRLMWAEPDTGRISSIPASEHPPLFAQPKALWAAEYRDGRWSAAQRIGAQGGMAWNDVTPTVADGTRSGAVAIGHAGIGGGFVRLYTATEGLLRERPLFVGGIPVYTSVITTPEVVAVGYITDASGDISRGTNSVFVMDSLAGGSSWSHPLALSAPGDGAATMLSLVRGGDDRVYAVWGQNLNGGLDAEAIRLVTLSPRQQRTSHPEDLRSGGVVTHLKVAADKRGNVHVVYQTAGADERPHVHYAFWSSTDGWNVPLALSEDAPSRDPSILLSENDTVYIAYSALIGMVGPYPQFSTVVVTAANANRHCARRTE